MSKVLYIIFIALGIIYLAVFLYIYPVLAKFYNSVKKNTFQNAFWCPSCICPIPSLWLWSPLHLPPFSLFRTSGYSPWPFCFFILVGFALLAFINGHFLVKIFDNYIIPEKDEISEEGSEETPDDTSRNTPAVWWNGEKSLTTLWTICSGNGSEKKFIK